MVPGSLLQSTLEELQELSERTFLLALQSQVKQQLSQRVDAPPSDLAPSPSVSELLNLLQEVLSVSSVAERRQQDLVKVRGKAVVSCFSSAVSSGQSKCSLSKHFLGFFRNMWSAH
jgi:hypothetical protein